MCAGITVYSPLHHWGAFKGGKRIGVVGIGGLGQMAIRLATAMGNEVTAISTSPNKAEAAKRIGAKHFVVSKDPESMKAATASLVGFPISISFLVVKKVFKIWHNKVLLQLRKRYKLPHNY